MAMSIRRAAPASEPPFSLGFVPSSQAALKPTATQAGASSGRSFTLSLDRILPEKPQPRAEAAAAAAASLATVNADAAAANRTRELLCLSGTVESLKSRLGVATERAAEADRQLQLVTRLLVSERNATREKLQAAENESVRTQGDVEALQSKANALKLQVDDWQTRHDTVSASVGTLQAECAQGRTRADMLSGCCAQLEEQKVELADQLAHVQARHESVSSTHVDLEAHAEALQERVQALTDGRDRLAEELLLLQARHQASSVTRIDLEAHAQELQERVNVLAADRDRLPEHQQSQAIDATADVVAGSSPKQPAAAAAAAAVGAASAVHGERPVPGMRYGRTAAHKQCLLPVVSSVAASFARQECAGGAGSTPLSVAFIGDTCVSIAAASSDVGAEQATLMANAVVDDLKTFFASEQSA